MTLAMSGATPSDSGLASGLVNTSVQVGGAIGLAVLATLATERTDDLLADGESTAAALTGGYHLAFLIGALCAADGDRRGGDGAARAEPGGRDGGRARPRRAGHGGSGERPDRARFRHGERLSALSPDHLGPLAGAEMRL